MVMLFAPQDDDIVEGFIETRGDVEMPRVGLHGLPLCIDLQFCDDCFPRLLGVVALDHMDAGTAASIAEHVGVDLGVPGVDVPGRPLSEQDGFFLFSIDDVDADHAVDHDDSSSKLIG